MSDPILVCSDVCKEFRLGPKVPPVHVLQGASFTLTAGEGVAVMGVSGSGKSTLLALLGGLDRPDSGFISLRGERLESLSEDSLNGLRNRNIGFIYQHHFLLNEFSAVENVMMPLLIRRQPRGEAQSAAVAMLEQVGLSHRLDHRPGELSGGERQRVAVARSLVTRPACVLADEPTGNLDRANAEAIFDLLLTLNREHGCALVVVTHDENLAQKLPRVLHLVDGRLSSG